MARAIQLEKPPIIEELPEAEEVEVVEEEVAAVSADIDYDNEEGDILVSAGPDYTMMVSGVEIAYGSPAIVESAPIFSPFYEKKEEPEKTYLLLPQGKRIIILD